MKRGTHTLWPSAKARISTLNKIWTWKKQKLNNQCWTSIFPNLIFQRNWAISVLASWCANLIFLMRRVAFCPINRTRSNRTLQSILNGRWLSPGTFWISWMIRIESWRYQKTRKAPNWSILALTNVHSKIELLKNVWRKYLLNLSNISNSTRLFLSSKWKQEI